MPLAAKFPWRYATQGIAVALRVTPRGGRDDFDGIEIQADGRPALKVRVKAIAEGGEANRAVIKLLSKSLKVPQSNIRLLSGPTSRTKQIAIDGDPKKLGEMLQSLVAGTDQKDNDDG